MVGQARLAPALQPIYSAPRFTTSVIGCQQPALAALFQQLESIPAADNHDLSIFNRGNGIDNAMNTGDRNTQRSENPSRFRCVIIPGLRYASERNKYR